MDDKFFTFETKPKAETQRTEPSAYEAYLNATTPKGEHLGYDRPTKRENYSVNLKAHTEELPMGGQQSHNLMSMDQMNEQLNHVNNEVKVETAKHGGAEHNSIGAPLDPVTSVVFAVIAAGQATQALGSQLGRINNIAKEAFLATFIGNNASQSRNSSFTR